MRQVSETWHDLYDNESHHTEFKMVINNHEYGMSDLVSLTSSCDVFQNGAPVIGQCISAQMEANIYRPSFLIPRRAECKVYTRLASGSLYSEWIEKGTFYIDKRKTNRNGVLCIKCFDAMRKADQLMYTDDGQQEYWPKVDLEVVSTIASDYLNVAIDTDTYSELSLSYAIQFPGYGDGGYTVRQVLGYIGALYGGNWIIDEVGKLKLLKLSDFPNSQQAEYHLIGEEAEDYDDLVAYVPISRVTINVGTEEATGDPIFYTAGDSTGSELSFDCPWGTQDTADNLISELAGFEYNPYTMTNAVIDPSFMLWDCVLVSGIYSGISSYTIDYNRLFTADISATGEEELDSEYPYTSKQDLVDKQTNAKLRSSLILTNQSITSLIESTNGSLSSIEQTIHGIQVDIVTINEKDDELAKYLKFDAVEGLTLGIPNKNTKVQLDETKLQFFDTFGDRKAYIGLDPNDGIYKLFVIKGHIVDELEHGDHWAVSTSEDPNGTTYRFTIRARG